MFDTEKRSNASAGWTRGYDLIMASDATLTVCADPAALAETAANLIIDVATEAVRERGRFMLCLAGGETPRKTYELLALPEFSQRIRWDRTWAFFGDERVVPPEHAESNYRRANEALLSRVPIPAVQVLRMRGEDADADGAAAAYAATLSEAFGTRRGELPRFDLVLLGLGVDGHTASLFPGSPVLREVFRTVAAVHVTAAQIPQRITLTFPVLNAAARVIFLVAGAEKAKIVKAVLSDQAMVPAGMIRPTDGELIWLADRAAAALHPIGGAR
jgi:6-phosphogluconolactonase